MISISANLNIMIKAAVKASKSIIRDFGEVEKLQVSKKGPYDFVTKTDKYVEKILIEELSKTKKNSLDDCLFSSNHEGVKFSNLNMRYGGCAALDLAYVSAGRLDGFFHNKINLWDVAAGEILVKEAGGIVNDIHKFDKNKIDIKASSDAINAEMLKKLKNF